jgi:hypothetical protein
MKTPRPQELGLVPEDPELADMYVDAILRILLNMFTHLDKSQTKEVVHNRTETGAEIDNPFRKATGTVRIVVDVYQNLDFLGGAGTNALAASETHDGMLHLMVNFSAFKEFVGTNKNRLMFVLLHEVMHAVGHHMNRDYGKSRFVIEESLRKVDSVLSSHGMRGPMRTYCLAEAVYAAQEIWTNALTNMAIPMDEESQSIMLTPLDVGRELTDVVEIHSTLDYIAEALSTKWHLFQQCGYSIMRFLKAQAQQTDDPQQVTLACEITTKQAELHEWLQSELGGQQPNDQTNQTNTENNIEQAGSKSSNQVDEQESMEQAGSKSSNQVDEQESMEQAGSKSSNQVGQQEGNEEDYVEKVMKKVFNEEPAFKKHELEKGVKWLRDHIRENMKKHSRGGGIEHLMAELNAFVGESNKTTVPDIAGDLLRVLIDYVRMEGTRRDRRNYKTNLFKHNNPWRLTRETRFKLALSSPDEYKNVPIKFDKDPGKLRVAVFLDTSGSMVTSEGVACSELVELLETFRQYGKGEIVVGWGDVTGKAEWVHLHKFVNDLKKGSVVLHGGGGTAAEGWIRTIETLKCPFDIAVIVTDAELSDAFRKPTNAKMLAVIAIQPGAEGTESPIKGGILTTSERSFDFDELLYQLKHQLSQATSPSRSQKWVKVSSDEESQFFIHRSILPTP